MHRTTRNTFSLYSELGKRMCLSSDMMPLELVGFGVEIGADVCLKQVRHDERNPSFQKSRRNNLLLECGTALSKASVTSGAGIPSIHTIAQNESKIRSPSTCHSMTRIFSQIVCL